MMDFSVICTASLGKENKWTINVYKPFHIRESTNLITFS